MRQPAVFDWTIDCRPPALALDEIHCWRVNLDAAELQRQLPLEILSHDEHARAARLRFADVARRFRVGRAALRLLLSQYTGHPPSEIGFAYGPLGKPLLQSANAPPLSFNLTHSAGVALVAVGPPGEIGIDVEIVRPMADQSGLVRRYFAPAEVDDFESLPVALKQRAFFVGWTRKEAAIKATGEGIAANLESIEVGFRHRNAGFRVDWQGANTRQCVRIWDLDAGPELAAALAMVERS